MTDRDAIDGRPPGRHVMHQAWGCLLFMHWPVDAAVLRPLIPPPLEVDTYDGTGWVGVVPFTLWDLRILRMPLPGRLGAFHELNVRTYVRHGAARGVWFFSLDAASPLAVRAARWLYHLPYHHAHMSLERTGRLVRYRSERVAGGASPAHFEAAWIVGEPLPAAPPHSRAAFLTNRFRLYAARGGTLFEARVHHRPWPLRQARLRAHSSTMMESAGLGTPNAPPLLHYAEAVQVDVWRPRRVARADAGTTARDAH